MELELSSRRGRIALIAMVSASSMTFLDTTVVNVALPRIGRDLDTGVGGLQWVATSYLITLASLILLGGALGDRFGRRRAYRVGIVWFAVASLGCGLAPSVAILVAARLLQGIGGALLTPGSLALIQSSFRSEDRAAAVGSWSSLAAVSSALGPFVGGWLVDSVGWRWTFLINLPFAAVALIATRAVPESRDPSAGGRFDIAGASLAVFALGGGTWSLIGAGQRGWGDTSVIAATITAIVTGVLFVVVQRRSAQPLVPPSLFASRSFVVLNLATFGLYAALSSQFFLVAYQLQTSLRWSALAAGSALMPATVMMMFLSARSGRLAQRIGPRRQLIIGPVLVAGAMVLLARVEPGSRWITGVLPGALLFGAGLVAFVAPLTATVMGSVDRGRVGTASAVNNAVARTAGLAAVAVIPVISGLAAADGIAATTDAFSRAMLITAALAISSAVIVAVALP